jgi:hypothetical protein
MLGRIGNAAIAIGLIVALAAASAQERIEPALESQPVPQPRQDARTEQSQDHAVQEEAEADRIAAMLNHMIEAATSDLIAEENAQQRERQEQREIADLQAQQDMALWAERMFWASIATVALTAVGLVLILRTLHYVARATRAVIKAAEDAERGVRATARAVEITEDTAKRQLRAYVGTSRVYFGDFNPARPISVIVEIQNFGQTPAYDYQPTLWLEVRPHPEVGAAFSTNEVALTDGTESLMPGNKSIVICKFDHPRIAELITAIERDLCALYLLGTIRYRDIFGNDRYTNARKLTHGDRIRTNSPFINPTEGNESN